MGAVSTSRVDPCLVPGISPANRAKKGFAGPPGLVLYRSAVPTSCTSSVPRCRSSGDLGLVERLGHRARLRASRWLNCAGAGRPISTQASSMNWRVVMPSIQKAPITSKPSWEWSATITATRFCCAFASCTRARRRTRSTGRRTVDKGWLTTSTNPAGTSRPARSRASYRRATPPRRCKNRPAGGVRLVGRYPTRGTDWLSRR